MPFPDEAELRAIDLPPTALARAAVEAWEAGHAVLPLARTATAEERDRVLAALRPTHLVDGDGIRALPGGMPVAAGTAAVVATSGTTAAPKGVELTVGGMRAAAHAYGDALDAGPGDVWLACLPLHHVAGIATVARSWVTGLRLVVHDTFDLARVAAAPRAEGATMVLVVPTLLARLLDADAPLEHYRRVVVGASACPPLLRARAEARGATVVETYGMTETWGGVAIDGRLIDGVDVAIAGDGEVLVRGPMVMRGYRLDDDATAAAIDHEGWLHTGDVGAFADGVLRVVDRKKDIVITGGVNVSPVEVETVLAQHPGVADICVLGASDREWGERVVACVVPADRGSPPTLDALRDFAREHLSAAKLPREVRLVDEIPRSASGKPLRRLLAGPVTP